MEPPLADENRSPERIDLARADAYGRSFAEVYDRWYDGVSDAVATADFVAARCTDRPVLELGVGSGRLALPLVARGCTVIGLDGSSMMLDNVPVAEGPGSLHLVRADMRALPFNGRIGVALIAFNTLFNLSSEAEQLELLQRLAELLGQDGHLIIEALDVTPLLAGPTDSIGIRDSGRDWLVASATQLDTEQQFVTGQHLEISDRGVTVRPWRLRWLTPNQLDHLCDAAGLGLAERYGSWNEDRFSGGETHISVYSAH
jgi:SAM-dependent methyltransferase